MKRQKGIKTAVTIITAICLVLTLQVGSITASGHESEPTMDPMLIPRFVNQLVIPPVYTPTVITDPVTGKVIRHEYTVDAAEFEEQILPSPLPATRVWGYGGMVKDPLTGKAVYFHNAPGATFEAIRGIPVRVKWENKITGQHLYAVDPTLHWANPNEMPMHHSQEQQGPPSSLAEARSSVPLAPHLHGGETQSIYDGHPDAWFTADGKKGSAYTSSEYTYLNTQQPATLWYHDHALGMTRINVFSGLAGFYLLRDPEDKLENPAGNAAPVLPVGKYDIPLVIQDRTFNKDGSFHFDNEGINPEIHPYWIPECFGDVVVVNGKAWPNLNVERRQYRFRVLNGSNARVYHMTLSNHMSFKQIASDGGYLPRPVKMKSLVLAPGERADLLVDFSRVAAGTSIILKNDAHAPYPDGDAADPETVGQIMQFTVPADAGKPVVSPVLPAALNVIPRLVPNQPDRTLTLNEAMAAGGPEEILLNGQKWSAPITEMPKVGSTEDWVIVNLTEDTHPIHLHLVQFQLISRQSFNVDEYEKKWLSMNGKPPLTKPTKPLPVTDYLTGKPRTPTLGESGWKDTFRMNPGEVTRIRVRFAPQDADPLLVKPGVNLFPFDPSMGPGYVWHCHIIDHEDNEMMRPYIVKP
jgi:spore coat protein A, manganese oxidase